MKEKKLLRDFLDHVLSLKTRRQLEDFFAAVLTPSELEEIPKRLAIVRLLKDGMPQREIARELGVGVATVTRGVRELRLGHFKDVKP